MRLIGDPDIQPQDKLSSTLLYYLHTSLSVVFDHLAQPENN